VPQQGRPVIGVLTSFPVVEKQWWCPDSHQDKETQFLNEQLREESQRLEMQQQPEDGDGADVRGDWSCLDVARGLIRTAANLPRWRGIPNHHQPYSPPIRFATLVVPSSLRSSSQPTLFDTKRTQTRRGPSLVGSLRKERDSAVSMSRSRALEASRLLPS